MNSIFHRISVRKYEDKPVEKEKSYADLKSRHAGSKRVQPAAVGILCGNG